MMLMLELTFSPMSCDASFTFPDTLPILNQNAFRYPAVFDHYKPSLCRSALSPFSPLHLPIQAPPLTLGEEHNHPPHLLHQRLRLVLIERTF